MSLADLEHRTRLREALALIGHDPGEDATLRELVVRAARVIKHHAPTILEQEYRARHLALPSSDSTDPWRVGAWVQVYDTREGRWQRHLIVQRDVTSTGTVLDIRYRSGASTRFRMPRNARYAVNGVGGAACFYAVPDGTSQVEALTWFGPQTFRGKYRAYTFWVFIGRRQLKVAVRARSLPEVVYLCAQAECHVTLTHLREFAGLGGGAAEAAANAHPDTLMVNVGGNRWLPYHEAAQC